MGGRGGKKSQRESVTTIKGLKTVLKEKVIERTELGSKHSHSNTNLVTKGSLVQEIIGQWLENRGLAHSVSKYKAGAFSVFLSSL